MLNAEPTMRKIRPVSDTGGYVLLYPPPPPRTTSKSHIGELAPMALCDIHVAGCGEHLPAWGLRDDRIPGTDQAVRGGRHGQKLHSGFPPRQVDARGNADARGTSK